MTALSKSVATESQRAWWQAAPNWPRPHSECPLERRHFEPSNVSKWQDSARRLLSGENAQRRCSLAAIPGFASRSRRFALQPIVGFFDSDIAPADSKRALGSG